MTNRAANLTEGQILARAHRLDIELTPEDIFDAGDCYAIDGVEASEWIDMMVAD
jgi:hypothetical protein